MIRALAILVQLAKSGAPPTAFRLFSRGWNDTEKGRFLFDDQAALAVMAAHEAWGVDVMIDLEHQSLNTPDGAPDPTARDARGWCKLELRDGDLWAVGVSWTPDGAARLTQKRQRYVSPAFETHEDEDGNERIVKIVNVAITALPATHKTPALVAASRRGPTTMKKRLQFLTQARDALTRAGSAGGADLFSQGHRLVRLAAEGGGLDPALIKQALDAVEKGDAKAALEILKGLIAAAAGAEPEEPGDEDGSEGDGAEGVAPPATADGDVQEEAVDHPLVESGDEGTESPEDEEDDTEGPKKKKMALRASAAMLLRITGQTDLMEALNTVETWRTSHVALETERRQLAKDRAVLEGAERRKLVVDLIQLGAEFPATVWADPTVKHPTKMKSRWLAMPIAELRAHVSEQRGARRRPETLGASNVKPLASVRRRGVPTDLPREQGAGDETDDVTTLGLDAKDLALCKQTGCDPATFARLKTMRDSATRGS